MSRPSPPDGRAKFLTGSTMRHVVVMTATGSVGLVAIFLVDALNLFYISLLGQQELAAAIGYAGTLVFFTTSVSIGLSIAATALTARALGRGARAEACEVAGASAVFIGLITVSVAVLAFPFIADLLRLLGAEGRTLDLATGFLRIVLPSMPVIGLGMCMAALLRAVGDARRAMYVTLGSGALTAVLDPLFIFGLELGINGAAIATVISRAALLGLGLHFVVNTHRLIRRPSAVMLSQQLRPFLAIGIPALMTQIATPVGNAFVTETIARHGDAAVAGWAVVGRIIPVAFGALFALSGAVGPIIGQNYGAQRFDRIRATMRDSLVFISIYSVAVWLILAAANGLIADLFGTVGEARDIVAFFCLFVSASFLFNGLLFVANAAFNNLGHAFYSTAFNWGRSTLGVIPFVWLGSEWWGAEGALAGYGLGAVLFGIGAALVAFRVIGRLDRGDGPGGKTASLQPPPAAQSPFTSGKASAL